MAIARSSEQTCVEDRLINTLGETGLLTDPQDMIPYETGARYDSGKARFVARPGSTEELSAVVSECVRAGIRMIAQSGNTGLVGGSTPDASGETAILSLDRMTGAIELNATDMTVSVPASTRLSTLNDHLEKSGFFFPIDLGADPMIGGMVATNTGGARFLRYGDVRANVVGLEVVLADEDGTVIDIMDLPRKNNVGLDLKHLFIGTCGRFGFVTRARLRVHPSSRQRATALVIPKSDIAATELLVEFERRAGPMLSAFEGMSGNAIKLALQSVGHLRNPFPDRDLPDYSVLVEISKSWDHRDGEHTIDELMLAVLEEIWEQDDSPIEDALIAGPEEVWAIRHALSHALADAGRVNAFDLGFDRRGAMEFRGTAIEAVRSRFPELIVGDFGHIGDGATHFNIVEPNGIRSLSEEERDELKALVYEVAVTRFGGSFSSEHGIGRNNQKWYEAYVSQDIRDIAERLRLAVGSGLLDSLGYK